MSRLLPLLFLLLNIACNPKGSGLFYTNRYYYVAQEPIDLYEFASFHGSALLTVNVGDTVSTTGIDHVGLGGSIPIDYKGFRFYSPTAKASLVAQTKIKAGDDKTIAATAYETVQRNKAQEKERQFIQAEEDSLRKALERDSVWYTKVPSALDVQADNYVYARTVAQLSVNEVVRVKRYDYNYWKLWLPNGKTGFVRVGHFSSFSRAKEPFSSTDYVGLTYHPEGELTGYYESTPRHNTPTTGATIHTGPRGGRYYINSHGNKTYVPRGGGSGRR